MIFPYLFNLHYRHCIAFQNDNICIKKLQVTVFVKVLFYVSALLQSKHILLDSYLGTAIKNTP